MLFMLYGGTQLPVKTSFFNGQLLHSGMDYHQSAKRRMAGIANLAA